MPGPVIPTPFMMPQGRQEPPGFMQQLLMSLIGQAGSGLVNAGINKAFPYEYPQQPAPQPSLEQNATMDQAGVDLARSGNLMTPERAQSIAQSNGLDVGRDRQQIMEIGRRTGPAELDRLRQEEVAGRQADAAGRARGLLDDPALQNAFDVAMTMKQSGADTSTINSVLAPIIPESESQRLNNLLTATEIEQAQTEVDADIVATRELKAAGLLPADSPERFPGAAGWYRDYRQEQSGKAVDWNERIAEHVFSRVGDSVSGLDPFAQAMAIANGADPSTFSGSMSVDDAVAEAVSIARQLDPTGSAGAVASVGSGQGRRLIDINLGRLYVDDILRSDPNTPIQEIRRSLREDHFTDSEIDQILSRRNRDRTNAR